MESYRVEAVVSPNRTLTVEGLPFDAGDRVEVVVRMQPERSSTMNVYTLRGKPVRYLNPFDGVAEHDWNAVQ